MATWGQAQPHPERDYLAEALAPAAANIGRGFEVAGEGVGEGITKRADREAEEKKLAAEQNRFSETLAAQKEMAKAQRLQLELKASDDEIDASIGDSADPEVVNNAFALKSERRNEILSRHGAPPLKTLSEPVAPFEPPALAAPPLESLDTQPPAPPLAPPVAAPAPARPLTIPQLRIRAGLARATAEETRNARELREATRKSVYDAGYTPEILKALPKAAQTIAEKDPEFSEQKNAEKMRGYAVRYKEQQAALADARKLAASKDAGDRTVLALLANNYQQDTTELRQQLGTHLPILKGALDTLAENPNDNNAAQTAIKTYIKLYDKGLVTADEFALAGREAGIDIGTIIERWRKNAAQNTLTGTSAAEIRNGGKLIEATLRNSLRDTNERYAVQAAANGLDNGLAKIGAIDPVTIGLRVQPKQKPKEIKPPGGIR